jgi:hypothetical protein
LKTDPIKEHEASCAKCIAGIYYCAERMKLVKAQTVAQKKKRGRKKKSPAPGVRATVSGRCQTPQIEKRRSPMLAQKR